MGDAPLVPGHLGEPCRLSGCVEGYCDDSICRPRVAEGVRLPDRGEPCTFQCARDGDPCDVSTGLCEPVHARGAPCVRDFDCSPFDVCDRGRCIARTGASLGGTCTFTGDRADPDAVCDYTTAGPGTCALATTYTCTE